MPGLDVDGGGIIGDVLQRLPVSQGRSQAPGHGIMLQHVGHIQPVTAAVAQIQPAQQHQTGRSLPGGQVVTGLQPARGRGVAALAIGHLSGYGVGIGVGQQGDGLLLPVLEDALQGQLSGGHGGFQPGVQRLSLRTGKLLQQQQIQTGRRRPKGFHAPGKQLRQIIDAAGKQQLTALFRQPGGLCLQPAVSSQFQPLQQHLQDLGRRLRPALFDLGQIGDRADAPAKALLTPVPAQPLPADQRSVISHPASPLLCFSLIL